jgi:hypothetical protein
MLFNEIARHEYLALKSCNNNNNNNKLIYIAPLLKLIVSGALQGLKH